MIRKKIISFYKSYITTYLVQSVEFSFYNIFLEDFFEHPDRFSDIEKAVADLKGTLSYNVSEADR